MAIYAICFDLLAGVTAQEHALSFQATRLSGRVGSLAMTRPTSLAATRRS